MATTTLEIKKIREISYNYRLLEAKDIASFDKGNLFVGFRPHFEPKVNDDEFIVTFAVVYEYKKSESAPRVELLSIEAQFTFYVKDLKSVCVTHGDDFQIPDAMMKAMLGASVSSIRGMIAIKTAGNFLTDYPLPLVDVDMIIDNIKHQKKAAAKKSTSKKAPPKKKAPKKQASKK